MARSIDKNNLRAIDAIALANGLDASERQVSITTSTTFDLDMRVVVEACFHGTRIHRIPPDIRLLDHLVELHIVDCEYLSDLLKEIGALKKLKTLRIIRCAQRIDLPNEVCHLTELDTLDLHHLTHLPEDIGMLANLRSLSIISGKLDRLPLSVLKLQKINNLALIDCCRLKVIPSTPGMFPNLESLQLCHSGIETLPKDLLVAPKLCWLGIVGCKHLKTTAQEIGESSFSVRQIRAGKHIEAETLVYARLNRLRVRNLLLEDDVPSALWSHALAKASACESMLYILLKSKPDLFA